MKQKRSLGFILATMTLVILFGALWSTPQSAHKAELSSVTAADPKVDAVSLFGAKCAKCHGNNGAGLPNWKARGQSDFTSADWQQAHTDAQIADTIREGKGKYMPAFKGKLSEEEISALVRRIRTFRK